MARHFPDWISAYTDFTRDSESPLAFHFWTAIATIAGALRRRVWLDMRKFVWTPNFYIILVGPPGVAAKSTSISIGMDLLTKLPAEAGIRFGPESMTWQALADSLSKATEYVKYTLLTGEDAIKPMSALTVTVGELGTFLTMDDDKLISFLIRMWDGGDTSFHHSTRSTGTIEVKSPWLNVIAATTPSWLSRNFPPELIGGGLTSRIIFVYGDQKRTLIPYPDEVILSSEYDLTKRRLLDDLAEIAALSGEFILTGEARVWGRQWYTDLYTKQRPVHMASDRYSGYIARKQTHLHKIAMVLAVSRRSKLVIELEDIEKANVIISMLEPSMLRVFESIGIVDEARHIAEISALLRSATGPLLIDDLWRQCYNLMSMPAYEASIKAGSRGGVFLIGQLQGRQTISLMRKETLQ